MKFRLLNRQIFFPVSESKFRFKLSSLTDYDANQVSIGVRLKQNFTSPFARIGRIITRGTTQHGVPSSCCTVTRIGSLRSWCVHDFDAAAEPAQIYLSSKESQGRSPIRTLGYLCSARGPIGRKVKPHIGAVNDEEFLFWRFVFPAHPAGLRKINGARLRKRAAVTVRVLFVKGGFESNRVSVSRFKRLNDRALVTDSATDRH